MRALAPEKFCSLQFPRVHARLLQTSLRHLDRTAHADRTAAAARDARSAVSLARKIEARGLREQCGICIIVYNDSARAVNYRDRICNSQGCRSSRNVHRHDAAGCAAVRSTAQILNPKNNLVCGGRGCVCVVKLRHWSAFRTAGSDRKSRSIHRGIHRSYGICKRTCRSSTRIREADALDGRALLADDPHIYSDPTLPLPVR
jgi:hypothetical protein